MIIQSIAGKKRIASGIQAMGGTGRKSSTGVNKRSRKIWEYPIRMPSGIPTIAATANPRMTRDALSHRSVAYSLASRRSAEFKTSAGDGTWTAHGRREKALQISKKSAIDTRRKRIPGTLERKARQRGPRARLSCADAITRV